MLIPGNAEFYLMSDENDWKKRENEPETLHTRYDENCFFLGRPKDSELSEDDSEKKSTIDSFQTRDIEQGPREDTQESSAGVSFEMLLKTSIDLNGKRCARIETPADKQTDERVVNRIVEPSQYIIRNQTGHKHIVSPSRLILQNEESVLKGKKFWKSAEKLKGSEQETVETKERDQQEKKPVIQYLMDDEAENKQSSNRCVTKCATKARPKSTGMMPSIVRGAMFEVAEKPRPKTGTHRTCTKFRASLKSHGCSEKVRQSTGHSNKSRFQRDEIMHEADPYVVKVEDRKANQKNRDDCSYKIYSALRRLTIDKPQHKQPNYTKQTEARSRVLRSHVKKVLAKSRSVLRDRNRREQETHDKNKSSEGKGYYTESQCDMVNIERDDKKETVCHSANSTMSVSEQRTERMFQQVIEEKEIPQLECFMPIERLTESAKNVSHVNLDSEKETFLAEQHKEEVKCTVGDSTHCQLEGKPARFWGMQDLQVINANLQTSRNEKNLPLSDSTCIGDGKQITFITQQSLHQFMPELKTTEENVMVSHSGENTNSVHSLQLGLSTLDVDKHICINNGEMCFGTNRPCASEDFEASHLAQCRVFDQEIKGGNGALRYMHWMQNDEQMPSEDYYSNILINCNCADDSTNDNVSEWHLTENECTPASVLSSKSELPLPLSEQDLDRMHPKYISTPETKEDVHDTQFKAGATDINAAVSKSYCSDVNQNHKGDSCLAENENTAYDLPKKRNLAVKEGNNSGKYDGTKTDKGCTGKIKIKVLVPSNESCDTNETTMPCEKEEDFKTKSRPKSKKPVKKQGKEVDQQLPDVSQIANILRHSCANESEYLSPMHGSAGTAVCKPSEKKTNMLYTSKSDIGLCVKECQTSKCKDTMGKPAAENKNKSSNVKSKTSQMIGKPVKADNIVDDMAYKDVASSEEDDYVTDDGSDEDYTPSNNDGSSSEDSFSGTESATVRENFRNMNTDGVVRRTPQKASSVQTKGSNSKTTKPTNCKKGKPSLEEIRKTFQKKYDIKINNMKRKQKTESLGKEEGNKLDVKSTDNARLHRGNSKELIQSKSCKVLQQKPVSNRENDFREKGFMDKYRPNVLSSNKMKRSPQENKEKHKTKVKCDWKFKGKQKHIMTDQVDGKELQEDGKVGTETCNKSHCAAVRRNIETVTHKNLLVKIKKLEATHIEEINRDINRTELVKDGFEEALYSDVYQNENGKHVEDVKDVNTKTPCRKRKVKHRKKGMKGKSDDASDEESDKTTNAELVAAEGFIKTQMKYYDIIRKSSGGSGEVVTGNVSSRYMVIGYIVCLNLWCYLVSKFFDDGIINVKPVSDLVSNCREHHAIYENLLFKLDCLHVKLVLFNVTWH